MIGIYKITNPEGSIYIGQSKDIDRRIYEHKSTAIYPGKSLISESYKKYGADNHIFEVVEECEEHELNIKERYWQDRYIEMGSTMLNSSLTKTPDKPFAYSKEYKELKKELKEIDIQRRKHQNSFTVYESNGKINVTVRSYDSSIGVDMDKDRALRLAKRLIELCSSEYNSL